MKAKVRLATEEDIDFLVKLRMDFLKEGGKEKGR